MRDRYRSGFRSALRTLRRLGRRLAPAAVALALAAAAYLQWAAAPPVQEAPRRSEALPSPPPAPPASGEVETTDPGTILIFETFYTTCRKDYTRIEPAGEDHAGLDRQALAARFPEWEVRSFSRARVELVRTTGEPCPQEPEWFTIGLKDGRVVVFEGRGTGGRVVIATGIRADRLTPQERQLLEPGIELESMADVEAFLEGLEPGDAR